MIDVLSGGGSARVAVEIHSLKRHPNGKMQMKIKEEVRKSGILEGSTNLVDRQPICVVRPDEAGNRGYEDNLAAKHQSRFSRVIMRE